MKYVDFFAALPALRTIGKVRKTTVAMRARRIMSIMNDELARLRELCAERLGDEVRNPAALQAMLELESRNEVPEGLEIPTIAWDLLPEDTLSAEEMDVLEHAGILIGVPSLEEFNEKPPTSKRTDD